MLKKNKSIALVMILALLIITSSCAPKNTQAEIDKPAKTSASWERKLCITTTSTSWVQVILLPQPPK